MKEEKVNEVKEQSMEKDSKNLDELNDKKVINMNKDMNIFNDIQDEKGFKGKKELKDLKDINDLKDIKNPELIKKDKEKQKEKAIEIEKEKEEIKAKLSKEEAKLLQNIESGKLDFEGNIEVADQNENPRFAKYVVLNYTIHHEMGLVINNKENVRVIRKTIKYLFKKIGSSLFKGGKGLLNISIPLFVFDKMSMLERNCKGNVYHAIFCNKMWKESDPLEKMKLLMTSCIASLHVSITLLKPFKPILGETFQGKIGDVNLYAEQISHHHPISYIYLKNDNFSMSACEDFDIKTYPNSVVASRKTKNYLILNDIDKTRYSIKFPNLIIQNTLLGKLNSIYTGEIIIKDKVHKLIGMMRFFPNQPGFFYGFYGWLWNQKKSRADFFRGYITQKKELLKNKTRKVFKSKEIISYVEGYWIEEIMFDGNIYWEIDQMEPENFSLEENPLPSDSRFRSDLQEFIKGNIDEAEKQKDILEVIQRNDKKLREQFLSSLSNSQNAKSKTENNEIPPKK